MKKLVLSVLFILSAFLPVYATYIYEPSVTTKEVQITSYPVGAKIELIGYFDEFSNGGSIIGETPFKIMITKIYYFRSENPSKEAHTYWIINNEEYYNGIVLNAIPPKKGYFVKTKRYSGDVPIPKKIFFNLSIPTEK
jgi:hypothetical protein